MASSTITIQIKPMKKIILLFILLITIIFPGSAQRQGGGAGSVEAIKIAYYTKKLSLTPAEAQKFWPIYNQYFNEIRQLRQQNRDLDEVSMEEKTVNVRKKYKGQFSQALSEDKVNEFFRVEKEFNIYLRRELQERRGLRERD
jgi:hypothetical protein